MAPQEVLHLRIQLPGLSDFSRQNASSRPDRALVTQFGNQVTKKGMPTEGAGTIPEEAPLVL